MIVFFVNRTKRFLGYAVRKVKASLWVISMTAIFIAIPFLFAVIVESEHELQALSRKTDRNI
jgi:hypothetical protein